MKRTGRSVFLVLLLLSANAAGQTRDQKKLTAQQQQAFLAERLPGPVIKGSFSAWGSFLFAALGVAIHTDDALIAKTELRTPFPDFYKPTWKEELDTIAAQTESSWKYDPARGYWVFAKPKTSKPFAITIAPKWTTDDHEIFTSYRPPSYPVGMDVYYYGSYSADDRKDEAALWEKVRNAWALGFASRLKKGVTVEEMQKVTVGGADALYFEGTAPKNDVVWRQWVFMKDGKAFIIVSSLKPEQKELLADVQAMVASFRVTP